MAARPTVTVHNYSAAGLAPGQSVPTPGVLTAPIRLDVVTFVHTNIRKNSRQAYAVAYASGEQTSAMSWGTGRAVARIPRVPGGGTGRSGQGAFGNMCRKGRMYAPTKIWRRWHRHVNVGQRRFAVCSALAASAVPALLEARGHRISSVEEVPLVIQPTTPITRTTDAVKMLKTLGAYADVERVIASRQVRSGAGKARNRRFTQRRGPLVVCGDGDGEQFPRALRNIPGVDVANVDRLNLLQLAPGGHVGRFIIWTAAAFGRLDALFGGAGGERSALKNGFVLPRAPVANADLARLINSSEVQAVVRPALKGESNLARQKKNPLRNFKAMVALNPYAKTIREAELAAQAARAKGGKKAAVPKEGRKERRTASKLKYRSMVAEEFTPLVAAAAGGKGKAGGGKK